MFSFKKFVHVEKMNLIKTIKKILLIPFEWVTSSKCRFSSDSWVQKCWNMQTWLEFLWSHKRLDGFQLKFSVNRSNPSTPKLSQRHRKQKRFWKLTDIRHSRLGSYEKQYKLKSALSFGWQRWQSATPPHMASSHRLRH